MTSSDEFISISNGSVSYTPTIAIGAGTYTTSDTIAIGYTSVASANPCIAIGAGAIAGGMNTTIIGGPWWMPKPNTFEHIARLVEVIEAEMYPFEVACDNLNIGYKRGIIAEAKDLIHYIHKGLGSNINVALADRILIRIIPKSEWASIFPELADDLGSHFAALLRNS